MGAKYSHGAWEQFADQASTILDKTKFDFFVRLSKLWQDGEMNIDLEMIFALLNIDSPN